MYISLRDTLVVVRGTERIEREFEQVAVRIVQTVTEYARKVLGERLVYAFLCCCRAKCNINMSYSAAF